MCKNLFVRVVFCLFSSSLMVATAWASASEKRMPKNHQHQLMQGHGEKMKMNQTGRIKLASADEKDLLAVLKTNESLHQSFFSYDGKKVEENAMAMDQAIAKIKNKEIRKTLAFASTKLKEITAKSDREANNENYHLVSMALIHLVNTYDLGNKYNAYSCPMVKKKWVQNTETSSKVQNPYAANMPSCGTKDTKF